MNKIKTGVVATSLTVTSIVHKLVNHAVRVPAFGDMYSVVKGQHVNSLILHMEILPNGVVKACAGYTNEKNTIRYIETGEGHDPSSVATSLISTLLIYENLGGCFEVIVR